MEETRYPVPRLGKVRIRTDNKFIVYGFFGDTKVVLGPARADQRDFKFSIPENVEEIGVLAAKTTLVNVDMVDYAGKELNDPRPLEIPLDDRPLTLAEHIQRAVRVEIARGISQKGYESFEESDDFEIEEYDDLPDVTRYTVMEEETPEPAPVEDQKVTAPEPEGGRSPEDPPPSEEGAAP